VPLEINDLNIILFAKSSKHSNDFRDFFTSRGVRIFTIISETQLENIIEIIPINGVVLDINSAMKASSAEKMIISRLEEIYPTIRIRWNSEEDQIDSLYPDDKIKNLDDFINEKCINFDPRVMRTSDRSNTSLNVLISNNSSLKNDEKSCTLNASDTGLFVISSSDNWKVNQNIYVSINELTHKTPIQGTIVRVIRWGEENLATPGISIRFDSIQDRQQDELFSILKQ
jgi:hypothetical protein